MPCISAGHTNGAQITTYHFNLSDAKDTSKLNRAIKWLSMALQTPCTIIPSDRAHFAVQVARRERDLMTLRQTISTVAFDEGRTPTTAALGTDNAGQPVIIDLAKMPHLLIAGATGSGKSVAINT